MNERRGPCDPQRKGDRGGYSTEDDIDGIGDVLQYEESQCGNAPAEGDKSIDDSIEAKGDEATKDLVNE